MGHIADSCFDAGPLRIIDAWFGLLGYAFQIYFDFSGYSDMAVGLALMLGFVLIQNFDSPYKSDSITEFWRRWHISLSTWLRDYLYIPLGGNRKGPAPHLREPDGGHAAGRAVARRQLELRDLGRAFTAACWRSSARRANTASTAACPAPLRVAITFLIVCLCWVFFRAKTLAQALSLPGLAVRLAPRSPPAADVVAGAIYTPYHGDDVRDRRGGGVGHAQHLGLHRAAQLAARAGRPGAAGAVDR